MAFNTGAGKATAMLGLAVQLEVANAEFRKRKFTKKVPLRPGVKSQSVVEAQSIKMIDDGLCRVHVRKQLYRDVQTDPLQDPQTFPGITGQVIFSTIREGARLKWNAADGADEIFAVQTFDDPDTPGRERGITDFTVDGLNLAGVLQSCTELGLPIADDSSVLGLGGQAEGWPAAIGMPVAWWEQGIPDSMANATLQTQSGPYNTNSSIFDSGSPGATCQITDGVVLFDLQPGEELPEWSTSAELIVDDETYAVATRDSDVQVTLVDLTVNKPAGTPYTLRIRKSWSQWSDWYWDSPPSPVSPAEPGYRYCLSSAGTGKPLAGTILVGLIDDNYDVMSQSALNDMIAKNP